MERKRSIAFTLIELLVVVAIIAVLAAILFPVFAQARESARKMACLSNSKQIATAIQMYAQDWDENIVPYKLYRGSAPIELQLSTCWVNTLQPYIKSGGATNNGTYDGVQGIREPQGLMACPSKPETRFGQASDSADCDGDGTPGSNGVLPASQHDGYFIAHYSVGFGGNCTSPQACINTFNWVRDGSPGAPFCHYAGAYYDFSLPVPAFVPHTLAEVIESARTAISADGPTVVELLSGNRRIVSGFGCEAALAHQEGGNFTFLDGHAKWIKGNAERYVFKADDGFYWEKYFSFDK